MLGFVAACGVNPQEATRTLEAQGVTKVKITGFSWMGCGRDDDFASNWKGIGVNGRPISGSICSGWFKGYTVRFD